MNEELIKEQLSKWMIEFLEKPNSLLGDWAPCPYARQARINNQIEIVTSNAADLYMDAIDSLTHLENKDVVVVIFDHNKIDPVTLQEIVGYLNARLMPIDYVVLEDHPNSPEYVNGVKMNFGHCGLLLLQKLSKLTNASNFTTRRT